MGDIHDVVIVGAGPGGSSAAYFLARTGMDVLLLDKSEFPREKTCGDGLTPRALGVLREMNILAAIEGRGHRINGIEIVNTQGQAIRMPIPQKDGLPEYLIILPRLILDEQVLNCALSNGANINSGVRVDSIENDGQFATVVGIHNKRSIKFRARMVTLATGANLKLPKTLGLLDRPALMLKAARAYFEGVSDDSDYVQAHFENVPLPGYGWVFPTSEDTANIGVGYWAHSLAARKRSSVQSAFNEFIQGSNLKRILANARLTSPVKGYPIRVDFPCARTFAEHILVVGEAAGLVSPLTGEGIDFALQSGKLAADHIVSMFNRGDLSIQACREYDRVLRDQFQHLFLYLNRIRKLYINPILLNRFINIADRIPELRMLLVDILLGHTDAAQGVNPRTIRQVLFGL